MATKVSIKTTFEAARTITPIYTGGEVSSDNQGNVIAACVEEDVVLFDVETGSVLCRIEGDGEVVTSLALSPQVSYLVVATRSLSLRIFSLPPDFETKSIKAQLQRTFKPHTTPVVASAIDSTGSLLATGGADGTVKIWDIRGGFSTHNFHGHGGIVSSLCFFQSESANNPENHSANKRKRKIADAEDVAAAEVPNSTLTICLASGGEDGKIKIWNLKTGKVTATLDAHVSVVRRLRYSADTQMLLSASRDKTAIMWSINSWKPQRIIPALEVLEAAGFICGGKFCYGGGENGILRIWNSTTGREVTSQQGSGLETDAILCVVERQSTCELLTLHQDHTIRIRSYKNLTSESDSGSSFDPPTVRTMSGNHDEIIDMACVGPDRSILALATNTERVRLISIAQNSRQSHRKGSIISSFGTDVAILEGHQDIIICMDVDWSGHWLATGAKDNTARLWRLDPATSSFSCVASLAGHAESLGAIALPRAPPASGDALRNPLGYPPSFLLTGSQDKTIKRWDTSKLKWDPNVSDIQTSVRTLYTRVAHEKDINALDVSPAHPLFASASQDRTIKIWSLEDGSVAGILRGHKRGVWSVRFAPPNTPPLNTSEGGSSDSKGLLVSGSGDRTVKIWSLSTYSCLLTFEGHSNSVLKVIWLPPQTQRSGEESTLVNHPRSQPQTNQPTIASASADTLIKLWSPYASGDSDHLLTTIDNHTDRVWSLASPHASLQARQSETQDFRYPYPLISGAADATITFWKDTTTETANAVSEKVNERIEQDQLLQNHIHARNYHEVITLALRLNHPGRLLRVFEDVMNLPQKERDQDSEYTGVEAVDEVLRNLSQGDIYLLLQRIRDWNTNIRTAPVAQRILNTLLKMFPTSTFLDIAKNQRRFKSDSEAHSESDGLGGGGNTGASGRSSRAKRPAENGGVKELFRALEVYTDRHFKRMEELMDESYLIDYTIREMDEIAGFAESKDGELTAPKTNGFHDVDMIGV